jgi:hypothetical protein
VIQKWLTVGVAEVLLSLILFAIAPIFLNSNKPAIGFAIWLAVPTMLGGSGLYVARRVAEARAARKLFLKRFPEYAHLGLAEFLEISPEQVIENLEMLEAIQNDPDCKTLNLSPFELLKGTTKQ